MGWKQSPPYDHDDATNFCDLGAEAKGFLEHVNGLQGAILYWVFVKYA